MGRELFVLHRVRLLPQHGHPLKPVFSRQLASVRATTTLLHRAAPLRNDFGCAVIGAEHHRSELQRSSDGKLRRCVLQDFLSDLECRRLDDRSCEVANPRDRHVATVNYGAEQIACAILHHW